MKIQIFQFEISLRYIAGCIFTIFNSLSLLALQMLRIQIQYVFLQFTFAEIYSITFFLPLQIQLIRIQLRVPEYGWTTQKVFHLLNFIVNGGDFDTMLVNSLSSLCLSVANFHSSCSACCCIWISC